MIEHRNGILIAVALMVGVPAITLVATLHQMFGTGGEGPIRASAVQAPAAAAPAASPSPSSSPSTAAPTQAPRAAAGAT
ncbi:cytochrome c4, partial [Achromobacter xylosoxidans]|nr:cytochrome c4 [Achromobacter xylosoxidans]